MKELLSADGISEDEICHFVLAELEHQLLTLLRTINCKDKEEKEE